MKRLAKGPIRTVPQAGLETACICIRIKVTNHEATARPILNLLLYLPRQRVVITCHCTTSIQASRGLSQYNFKKGELNVSSNYRPVSLLSSLSKILEPVVLCQLQNFISHFDPPILPPEQFTYRHGPMAIPAKTSSVRTLTIGPVALDAGKAVGVVIMDMSKAFDCVDHELLLLEFQSCRIGGTALVWFAGYLHGRISRVQTSHAPPGEEFEATRGVPQGSVLGPLLFSLCIRILPSVLRRSLLSRYADDITL